MWMNWKVRYIQIWMEGLIKKGHISYDCIKSIIPGNFDANCIGNIRKITNCNGWYKHFNNLKSIFKNILHVNKLNSSQTKHNQFFQIQGLCKTLRFYWKKKKKKK